MINTGNNEQALIDQKWMNYALSLADKADALNEIPVGAVLIKDDRIIAEGWNISIANHDACGHAEIRVIRAGGKVLENYRLIDCTLYVTLEPCPMCAGALLHGRVKRIVYGAPDLKAGAAGTVLNLFSSQAAYHYAEVEGGILEQDCRDQLQQFFKRRRKEIKEQKKQTTVISSKGDDSFPNN